jgi:hypothetical protein
MPYMVLAQVPKVPKPFYFHNIDLPPDYPAAQTANTPQQLCDTSVARMQQVYNLAYADNPAYSVCMSPVLQTCETSTRKYYDAISWGGSVNDALTYKYKLLTKSTNQCDSEHVLPMSAYVRCEGFDRNPALDYLPTYQPNGTCQCPTPRDPPNATAKTTWDDKKRECIACPLANPTDLETLIAQYDTNEEAKACTRKLEAGGNCDNLVKPALLTAKACLQTKMAEVGFAWNGSTTSLFRTRGYQAHFWDLKNKGWTRDNLAALSKSNPSGYKSCTPPPQGLHKNHALMNNVANPDSVNPYHTKGSAFDVDTVTVIERYQTALKKWNLSHQKDANFNERTLVNQAAMCGLRWGGTFNPVDTPHFDLGN